MNTDSTNMTVLGETLNPNTADQQVQDAIAELVGEGKKYKDAAELAKAYKHADGFIETLKREKTELEQKYQEATVRSRTIEELMETLQSERTIIDVRDDQSQSTQNVQTPDIAQLLEVELEKREAAAKVKENQKKSWEKLASIFNGEEAAKKVVAEYVNDNPVRLEIVNKLGSFDPEGLVELIQTHKPRTESFTTEGTITIPVDTSGGLTWKRANEVKKADPKLYNSRNFQQKLHDAASNNPNFWK